MNIKYSGFFDEVISIETQIGLPKLSRHLAVIKRLKNIVTGSGFSIYKENSLMASMGEAVERYCASIRLTNEQKDIKNIEKININNITRSNTKRDNVSKRKWTEVSEFITLKKKLVPSELIYLFNPDYLPIRDIISTGLAAYSTLEGAIVRGLCECIERDAFMLFWMLSCVNFKIDIDTINQKEIKILLNKAHNSGLKVDIYDITTEFGVPVILTIIRKEGVEGFYLSCAANFDYRKAIRKSLEEGLGGYSVYIEATLIHKKSVPDDLENTKSLFERPTYYLNNKKDKLLNDIIKRSNLADKSKKYKEIKNVKITLYEATNALDKNNISIYFKDITTPDVNELGFKVVRVIMPELAFLPIGEPMLHCDRLAQKAQELNREYNLEPHPFP